ncbi:MAG: phosphotransferase [Eggerthellaceae bacterium]|nr:phosphotransferase [Eggerthellaceae bacterium]
MSNSTNILDVSQLEQYVNENAGLRQAVGAAADDVLRLEPFAQGEYNVNYKLVCAGSQEQARYLFRVNLGSQMHLDHQIEYEMNALRLLAPSGRVPQAVYVDGSKAQLPYGVGVETLLPGRPLDYSCDLAEAAAILADIHAVAVPSECGLVAPGHPVAAIVDECEQMFNVYRTWDGADASLVARIDALFKVADGIAQSDRRRSAPENLHVVNTEVNSSNFLINPGRRGYLVDWEKPVLGEVEQDLAHFLVPTTTFWKTDTQFTRADVEGFVDQYVRAVDRRFATDSLSDRLDDYLVVTCLRGLTWSAMALSEYVGGGRAAANADTFAKIQEYVQDPFLSLVEREYYS